MDVTLKRDRQFEDTNLDTQVLDWMKGTEEEVLLDPHPVLVGISGGEDPIKNKTALKCQHWTVSLLSPSALHGLGLVQTGLDHSRQTAETTSTFGGLGLNQTPHSLQSQQGVQAHAEVVVETPLEGDVQGFT